MPNLSLTCSPGHKYCRRQTRKPSLCSQRRICCASREVTLEQQANNPWASAGWRGAWVSSQTASTQAAIVAGVTVLGAALTAFTYYYLGPWLCANVPLMDRYMTTAPLILGPFIAAVGVTHFTLHERICSFYPHKGAWGFWYLPGSPSFHVNWTGVAEILGGVVMLVGSIGQLPVPAWLLRASAFGLFLLVTVVSPSNIYMWTHNAPGPFSDEFLDQFPKKVIPLHIHIIRATLQVVLLSTFLGLALHSY